MRIPKTTGTRDYTCKTCRYPATNPKEIGAHYFSNPDHRPHYQSKKKFKQIVGIMIPKTAPLRPRGRPPLNRTQVIVAPSVRKRWADGRQGLDITPFDKLNSLVAEFTQELTKEEATILDLEKQLQTHKDELNRLQAVLKVLGAVGPVSTTTTAKAS